MLDVLLKHAKDFVKHDVRNGEEKAQYVAFYEDGSLCMIDGTIAAYAHNVHTEKAHVRNVQGKKVKAEGLPQSRVLQLLREPAEVESAAALKCNIDVQSLLPHVQTLNALAIPSEEDDLNVVRFIADEKGLQMRYVGDDVTPWVAGFQSTYHDTEETFSGEHKFAIDALKLEIALQLIADIGYDDMRLYYSGSLAKPIELRSYDGMLRIVIMQVRTYK